jgi:hypothetical protein
MPSNYYETRVTGSPTPLSVYPSHLHCVTDEMSFTDRALNIFYTLSLGGYGIFHMFGVAITFLTQWTSTQLNARMLITIGNPLIDYPHPHTHSYKHMMTSRLNATRTYNKIESKLQEELDVQQFCLNATSTRGTVLLTLSTYASGGVPIPKHISTAFHSAFQECVFIS